MMRTVFENYKNYIFAVILGSVLALAFPPLQLGFLAYFSLIPILRYAEKGSVSAAFKIGYWWGFGFQAALLFWMAVSTVLGAVLSFFWVSLYPALALMIYRWFYQKIGRKALIVLKTPSTTVSVIEIFSPTKFAVRFVTSFFVTVFISKFQNFYRL